MAWGREEDQAFLRTLPPDAPALVGMPELWPECEMYATAWRELSASRSVGMGAVGFIPIAEIVAYAEVMRVEDVETLVRHVRAMDAVFVSVQIEKQKRDAESKHQRQADHVPDLGGR